MKRIAIFCDGTWNRADARHATNVVKLSQALEQTDAQGNFQSLYYLQGVGSGRGTGVLTKTVDRVGGGAFGWGLTQNIEEAYRHLVFAHRPGDKIHIFGFSRGAYTARSLAGLIRSSSIPPADAAHLIPEAIRRYRSSDPTTKPNEADSYAFRHSVNPAIVTSEEESKWRRDKGLEPGTMIDIAYLGVWDTVGSLGLPGRYGWVAKLTNAQYAFHDTALSRSVKSARHAVAIDERRQSFEPALWGNLPNLNAGKARDARPYRQEWFPGAHGSVGGGGDISELSDAALVWIAEGAEAAGLRFEETRMEAWRAAARPEGPLDNRRNPSRGFFSVVTRISQRDRDGPDDVDDIADFTRLRWKALKDYRPVTLDKVRTALEALP